MSEAIRKCLNPVCEVKFEPGGLAVSPKAYCCEACRKQAWVLREAARLLEGLSDEEKLEVLREP